MVAGRLLSKLVDFATLLVLTHLLEPADFGLVAMGMTLVLVVEAVLELPVTQALVRMQDPSPASFDTAFTLSLLRGGAMAALIAGLAHPLAAFYHEPRLIGLVLALALGPCVRGLLSPRMVIYQRQLNFRWSALIEVLGKLAALLAAAAVAFVTSSYWALAVANVATPLIMATLSYVVAPYRPRLRLTEWRQFADMAGWHSLSQLATAFNWQMDKFLLGRYTEPVSLGRFFMAENVASIPNNAIIGPVAYPLLAAFAPLTTKEAFRAAYARASTALVFLGAPALIGLAVLADPLVRIVFDPKWLYAAPLIKLLALSNLVPLPTEPVAGLAMALNRTRWIAWRSFLNFAVRLPATLIGVIYFGVDGAIVARIVANGATFVLGMLIVRRLIDLSLTDQLRCIVRPAAALAAMSVGLLLIEPSLRGVSTRPMLALATLLTACVGGAVYLAVAYAVWCIAGRPAGAEAIAATRLTVYVERLRRKSST